MTEQAIVADEQTDIPSLIYKHTGLKLQTSPQEYGEVLALCKDVLATSPASKPDTSKQRHAYNQILEAAAIQLEISKFLGRDEAAAIVRALKSAIPSTIKAEPGADSSAQDWDDYFAPPLPQQGGAQIEMDNDSVDRSWNKFNKAISDGPGSPFPGMAKAFENYYSQQWEDRDWRNETSIWAAAWKSALTVAVLPKAEGQTAVPAGYRLQPISEFDAYADVLRQINNLEKENARLKNEIATVSPQGGEANSYPHEKLDEVAASRYKVLPTNSGFWPYSVKAGDGEAELYKGHKSTCDMVARRLTGAFLDGAFALDSLLADPASLGEAKAVAPEVQPRIVSSEFTQKDAAYDLVDRFLRNSLSDDDYADYSGALELLYAAPVAQALPVATETIQQALQALYRAKEFITNGVALGFIRMPDADTPDPAHGALPAIEAAIAAMQGSKP
jgi:hypothetical protein